MLINRKDVRKWQVFKSENNTIAELDEGSSSLAGSMKNLDILDDFAAP